MLAIHHTEQAETPAEYWPTIDQFFRTPTDADLNELQKRSTGGDDPSFAVPPLGFHYTERWAQQEESEQEAKASAARATEALKLPEGAGQVFAGVPGDIGVFDPPLMQHSLAQRLTAALVEDPTKQEPGDETLADRLSAANPGVLNEAAAATTPEVVNDGIVAELRHVGLLDPEDDTRLRGRDCEDDGLCIQIRAWQESLKVVTATTDRTRKVLLDVVKPKLAKLQKEKVKEEEARLIAKYMSLCPPPPKATAKKKAGQEKSQEKKQHQPQPQPPQQQLPVAS